MVMSVLRSKKFAKRVLWGLLILIIPAFVLWGVGNVTRSPAPVGTIGDRKISMEDFAKSRQATKVQILLTYFNNYEMLSKLFQNRPVINQMAWERLIFLEKAREKGLKATNNEVVTAISTHPLFQRSGSFNTELYTNILRNNLSMTPRTFEELIRENIQIQKFRQSIIEDLDVPDENIRDTFHKTNDQVELSYIFISKTLPLGDTTVTEEEAKKLYEDNKDRFYSPEKVEVEYIEMEYDGVDQRDLAGKKIEEIYPDLKTSPEKFREYAEKHGLRYGKTEPFSREGVIPGVNYTRGLQEMAFDMEEGDISRPLFSSPQKGAVYVFRKTGHIPTKPVSYEEIHDDLIQLLTDQKRLKNAEQKANEYFAKITDEGITLEEASNLMDIPVMNIGPLAAGGYIENVGPAKNIVFNAVTAGKGEVIRPITTQNGVILARVDTIIEADETVYEEQKDAIRANILMQKQMMFLDVWLKENTSDVELKAKLDEI